MALNLARYQRNHELVLRTGNTGLTLRNIEAFYRAASASQGVYESALALADGSLDADSFQLHARAIGQVAQAAQLGASGDAGAVAAQAWTLAVRLVANQSDLPGLTGPRFEDEASWRFEVLAGLADPFPAESAGKHLQTLKGLMGEAGIEPPLTEPALPPSLSGIERARFHRVAALALAHGHSPETAQRIAALALTNVDALSRLGESVNDSQFIDLFEWAEAVAAADPACLALGIVITSGHGGELPAIEAARSIQAIVRGVLDSATDDQFTRTYLRAGPGATRTLAELVHQLEAP